MTHFAPHDFHCASCGYGAAHTPPERCPMCGKRVWRVVEVRRVTPKRSPATLS